MSRTDCTNRISRAGTFSQVVDKRVVERALEEFPAHADVLRRLRCTVAEQRFADGPILAVDVPCGTVDRVPEIDHGQPLRLRVTPETFVDGYRRDGELPSDALDYVHACAVSAEASHVPVACFGRLPRVEQRAGKRIGEVLAFIATQPGGQKHAQARGPSQNLKS